MTPEGVEQSSSRAQSASVSLVNPTMTPKGVEQVEPSGSSQVGRIKVRPNDRPNGGRRGPPPDTGERRHGGRGAGERRSLEAAIGSTAHAGAPAQAQGDDRQGLVGRPRTRVSPDPRESASSKTTFEISVTSGSLFSPVPVDGRWPGVCWRTRGATLAPWGGAANACRHDFGQVASAWPIALINEGAMVWGFNTAASP
jgi:hypothetical protein